MRTTPSVRSNALLVANGRTRPSSSMRQMRLGAKLAIEFRSWRSRSSSAIRALREDADCFVRRLAEFAPDVLVTQHFHDAGNGFGADTGEAARHLLEQLGWTEDDYHRCVASLRKHLHVYEAEAGFFPPPRPVAKSLVNARGPR